MKKIAIFVLLFSILTLEACKESIDLVKNEPQIPSQNINISQAKVWFEKDFYPKNKNAKSQGKKREHKLKWENAKQSKFSDGQDLVVVPVETKIDGAEGNKNSFVWFYKDINKKEKILVVDLAISKSNMAGIDLNNFSGLMTIRGFDGELLNGFVFENNKAVTISTKIDGEETSFNLSQKKGRSSSNCYTYYNLSVTCIDYFYGDCIRDNLGNIFNCTYSFSNCTLNYSNIIDINCPWSGTVGTSGNTSPTTGFNGTTPNNNFYGIAGKLCGNYIFINTGNGLTAEIVGLGATAYNSNTQQSLNAKLNNICITFGSYVQTSNNATIAFNEAWNKSLQDMDYWLHINYQQSATMSNLAFSAKLMDYFKQNLSIKSYSSFSLTIGPCFNIPPSQTTYCL